MRFNQPISFVKLHFYIVLIALSSSFVKFVLEQNPEGAKCYSVNTHTMRSVQW